jgi:hypothetical protein
MKKRNNPITKIISPPWIEMVRVCVCVWGGGGGQKFGWDPPNTSEERLPNKHEKAFRNEETRNLRKSVLASKVVNHFTRALGPHFIGRRRDFYISRLPSNLKNIPSVNMYMNVFYIM